SLTYVHFRALLLIMIGPPTRSTLFPYTTLFRSSLPEGLIVRPALVWRIVPKPLEAMEVSYLTTGFSWDVNYVMNLQDQCLSLTRSEEHTSELQSRENLVCRLLLEKKKGGRHDGL